MYLDSLYPSDFTVYVLLSAAWYGAVTSTGKFSLLKECPIWPTPSPLVAVVVPNKKDSHIMKRRACCHSEAVGGLNIQR